MTNATSPTSVGYITSFIRGSFQSSTKGIPPVGFPERLGYIFVEANDKNDGKRYRYTGNIHAYFNSSNFQNREIPRFELHREISHEKAPRYGVTYDDISTKLERANWIAGSSLKIIDLETQEIIAERIGYMMDIKKGNIVGGRSPWLLAAHNACPSFYSDDKKHSSNFPTESQTWQTSDFVEKVLKPKK